MIGLDKNNSLQAYMYRFWPADDEKKVSFVVRKSTPHPRAPSLGQEGRAALRCGRGEAKGAVGVRAEFFPHSNSFAMAETHVSQAEQMARASRSSLLLFMVRVPAVVF